jgi:hypothetical protein
MEAQQVRGRHPNNGGYSRQSGTHSILFTECTIDQLTSYIFQQVNRLAVDRFDQLTQSQDISALRKVGSDAGSARGSST